MAHPRLTLVATGLGLFMIFLDATIVNVALPDIQDDLGGGEGGLQWVVAAYTLTMGMFMMSSASLADRHGRRRLLVSGMVLFAGASALCGLAPSLPVLAGARALQGVGAAVVNVTSLALVSAAYPDKQAKARAIGAWTGIAAVGLAIGPTVGGLLAEHVGWRSIFSLNVVVGAVGVVLVRAVVTESRDPADREADLRGQLLFILGVGALTYGLIQGPQRGWASPEIVALLVGSLAVLAVFVLAELRARQPMMDVRLFGDRAYTAAIVTIFAVLFGIYGSFLVVTQYFQNVQGYSAQATGLLMLANTVPTVVLSPVAGRLAGRIGGRRPTLVGVSCAVAGLCLLAFGPGAGLAVVLAGLFLLGCAGGLAIAPATNVAMGSVPEDRAGMASGIMSAQRALGSTAGYAVMGSVLAAVVALSLPGDLEAAIPDAAERQQVVEAVVADANPSAAIAVMGPGPVTSRGLPAVTDEALAAADGAFDAGIRAAQLVAAGLAVVALVVGWFLLPRQTLAGTRTRSRSG